MTITKTFTGEEAFEALSAAHKWCDEQGISYGSLQRDDPVGLMWGDYDILKWRNLSEIESLHGRMTGNKRHGPVTIEICERPKS